MSGRADLSEIYPVSRETERRLALYVERLEAWQKKTNLVASSTLEDIWDRHIADSLQCMALEPQAKHWLDLGSGGGFPGMVIAAELADREDSSVHLIESNQKKASFLRQANRQMKAKAEVICCRIEEAPAVNPAPTIVTARALAELPLLLKLSAPWLMAGTTGLFHKGQDFQRELSLCDGLWSFDLVIHESRILPESVILEISNLEAVAA